RNRHLADGAPVVVHLLLPPALQVQLPDLRQLADAVAVLDLLELLPQVLPRVLDVLVALHVIQRLAVAGELEGLDTVFNAGDGQRLAPRGGDAPDLHLAVVGRPLLALALAVAGEVDPAAVRAPARRAVVGPVERQPPYLTA